LFLINSVFKCKLNDVVKCLNLSFKFKESDYEYLEELVKVLKPIAQKLDYLQAEKNFLVNSSYPR